MPGCGAQSTSRGPADAPGALGLGIRLAVTCGLLAWGTHLWGADLVNLLLPAFAWIFSLFDTHFRILLLEIGSQGADTVVRLQVTLDRPLFLNGRLIMPDPRGLATVTTTIGTILQAPLVCCGLLLAWPGTLAGERWHRLLAALPALAVLLAIDTPFILLASLWDLFVHSLDPGRLSPLLVWQRFLIGGGRLALAITLGIGIIVLAHRRSGRSFRADS